MKQLKRLVGVFSALGMPRFTDVALISRGIAAASVVFWHLIGFRFPASSPWIAAIVSGRLAVWVFFILSGYLIGASFQTGRYEFALQSVLKFYRNRLIRVYPLFLFVTAAAIAWRLSRPEPFAIDLRFVLREVLMLQFNQDYSLNGSFWTLGIEMQFYCMAPVWLWLQRGRGELMKSIALYGMSLAAFACAYRAFGVSRDLRNIFGMLFHFQAGIVAAKLAPRLRANSRFFPRSYLICAIAALLGALNSFYFLDFEGFLSVQGIFLADLFGVGLLALHVVCEERGPIRGPAAWTLGWLGVLSYGIYAWHALVIEATRGRQTAFAPLFALVCIVSAGSFFGVERPARLRWMVKTSAGNSKAP